MSNKHYVVWVGRNPGIYPNWTAAEAQVKGFSGAQYRSFPSYAEAKRQFDRGPAGKAKKGSQRKSPPKTQTNAASNAVAHKTPNGTPPGLAIYCDGGCEPNPGEAGAGLAVYRDGELQELLYGAYEAEGTNNTAELNGMIKALDYAAKNALAHPSIVIYCDSKYVIQSLTEWAPGWLKRDWKKADGKPVQNVELIKTAFTLYEAIKANVRIEHVLGHKGIIGNELADRMALKAIASKSITFQQMQIPDSLTDILAAK